jgi:ABC-type iron transport system FetAB ATPase subunit
LRLLAGLLRPDAGDGTFLGRPLLQPLSRRHLGYMTQRNALYPDLTVFENLAFRAAVHGVDRAHVDEAVAAYGIGDVLGQRVSVLSGFLYPFETLPRWAQIIGTIFPLSHFIRAAHDVVLRERDVVTVLAHGLPMMAFMVVALRLAMRACQRQTSDL